jgi:endonuclease YncB( thermonuclease family)
MTASSESNPPAKLIVVVRRAHGLRDDLVGLPKASVMLQCNGQQHRTLVAGRTLARLVVEGRDINLAMVADGLAWHFTRYSNDPALAAAEAEARAARIGLWADEAPVAPWEWRASEAERKR